MRHPSYRADIQIYRAIAVLEVLLYHMGVPGFASGFLGVDIFFVISGYLMTILYTEGSRARDFYLRRAKRLLPAYGVTVAATLAASLFIVVPSDLHQVVQQATYASTLTSNIGYALQSSYFKNEQFNPLLHLWSLAVECQFYVLFPLLIIIARRWPRAFVGAIVSSLLLCLVFVLISPKLSFFMLPMRVWEFAFGIWAANRAQTSSALNKSRAKHVGGIAALAALILVPLLPLNGRAENLLTGHPAAAALLVCSLTAIALITRLPETITKSLPGRAAQRLGDVSYSLYLAHWPVLVLMHYVPFGGTRSAVTGWSDVIVASAVIAVATTLLYHLFERPGQRLFTPLRAVAAFLLLAISGPALAKWQQSRFDPADRQIFAAMTDRSYIRCGKTFRLLHLGERVCPVGAGSRGTVLLIGDSFSDSLKEAFAAAASRHGFASFFAVDNQPLITRGWDASWLKREIQARQASTVYLHYTADHYRAGVLDAAKMATAGTGARVVAILPPPTYSANVPQSLYLHRHGIGRAPERTTLSAYRASTTDIVAQTQRLGIETVDIAPLFCSPACATADAAGRPLYFDHGHLTLTGARLLIPTLENTLK